MDDIDLEGALRKYAAHKGWYTRASKKVTSLLGVLTKSYSWEIANEVKQQLELAERQISYMSQVTDWLEQEEYATVADHRTEVANEEATVEKQFDNFNNIRAARDAPGAAQVAALQPPNPPERGIKLVSDLKPDKLQPDASTTDYRQWKRQFTAYFSASHLDHAPTRDQHAYLESCLHADLAKVVSREATNTTPTIGENSCFAILDNIFKNKYPIILRRKAYFSMVQKHGQDERSFLEDLRATADEADIAGMGLNDALCMQLLTGLTDKRLIEKLGEVENPNIEEFSRIINAHMHAKASTPSQALKTSQQSGGNSSKRGQNRQGGGNRPNSRPQLSEQELARRKGLYNKCLRCGEEGHFIKTCTVRNTVVCGKCKVPGHIARACNFTPAARAVESDRQEQLQLTYEGQEEWQAAANVVQSAATRSQPTPNMLL